MKSKIFLSALILSSGLALTSCSDFLDSSNKSNVDSDSYFTTEEGFENLAATPYYKLRAIYDGDPALFCSGTDLYEKGRSNYSDPSLSLYKTLSAENSKVGTFYQNCYDGIQQANTVIYYAKKGAVGKNVAKRVDEAKFLKAYYYYLLSQQFGGVPISDDYIASVKTSFPRESLEKVYTYIETLLKEVESNNALPAEDHTGRVSMKSVYNLLAKTYLAWGWDIDVEAADDGSNQQVKSKTHFELAAQYADKAIAGKKPTMSFKDMWDVKNNNNEDVFFNVNFVRGISGQDETVTGNQQMAQFGNYYNDEADTKYTTSQYPASEKLLYLFEPGDDRFDATFMVEQWRSYMKSYTEALTDNTEILYYFPAWYTDLSKLDQYNASKPGRETTSVYSSSDPCVYIKVSVNKRTGKITYTKAKQRYATSRTSTSQSICIRKFDDYTATRNTTKGVSFHNIVLGHLTETYLIAAEAYHMAGNDTKSLEYLNVVRERSHATALTSYASYIRHYSDGTDKSYNNGAGIADVPYETNLDPVDVILDERARELCGEYYRWMDLRRTKRLVSYNVKWNSGLGSKEDMMGPDGHYRWYRPIPQNAINLNDAFTEESQNPGYVSSGK